MGDARSSGCDAPEKPTGDTASTVCADDYQVGVPPLRLADNLVGHVITGRFRTEKPGFNMVGQIGEDACCIGQRGPTFVHERILKEMNRYKVGQPDSSVDDVDGAQMCLRCRQLQSESHGVQGCRTPVKREQDATRELGYLGVIACRNN
jgi:hypothetical protein